MLPKCSVCQALLDPHTNPPKWHFLLAHLVDRQLRLREMKEPHTMVITTLTAAKQLYIY